MKVRKANLKDLDHLIQFTAEEAHEAEGAIKVPDTLRRGVETALNNSEIATYWVLTDTDDEPIGSISIIKEWSDWNAGFYWWIQSMYLKPEYRGKGLMNHLLDAVKSALKRQSGLELRLYVHKNNKTAIKAYEKAQFRKSDYEIMVLDHDALDAM